jgi:hypothetical protein
MDNRLEQAIRTLRGIRQRYETESDPGSGRRRSYTLQVALGHADMRWITAAIEALEKVVSYELLVPPANGAATSSVRSSDVLSSEEEINGAMATAKRSF